MAKFRISVLSSHRQTVIGERDLEGLRGFLRSTLKISDEKAHAIERELQDYKPFRVALEIVPFDE